ncbi:hypothetical protein CCYA_CCYA12G3335 [Cyanidiococcus yangmingshanensis]|nr:hypothetical protein CCYA_CCYA12G3335 [Cyanidiococcus yangmingshanensis]
MRNLELPLVYRRGITNPLWKVVRTWRKRPISIAMLLVTVLALVSMVVLRERLAAPRRESRRALKPTAYNPKKEMAENMQSSSSSEGSSPLWTSACVGEVLFFIRCRASDFPERARVVLDTWGQSFPPSDIFFVSGDPVADTLGAQVIVEPRIGADPLYTRFSVHDPLILPIAWKQLQARTETRYIVILEIDTFVLPDNLCSYAIPELGNGRTPFNDHIYGGFGMVMGPPWGANAAGSSCLEAGKAPRDLTAQPLSGTFAFGQNGAVLSRALVRDLAPYAEAIWAETNCIDAGDMRLWMGMYFHENDALRGHQVRGVTPCFALTAPGNVVSKYATLPPEHPIMSSDYDVFYATLPQTNPEDARNLWKMVRKLKISALSVGDIMLGFRRL